MGSSKGLIHCGCDDSNHRGKEGHEIILATFSLFGEDGNFLKLKNRKNCRPSEKKQIYDDARMWMKDISRDYRFAALRREEATYDSNITLALPNLVNDYLRVCPYDISGLRIYIDGNLEKRDKNRILNELSGLNDVKVENVTKKRIGRKRYRPKTIYCPKVLWAADIWANIVYKEGVRNNLNHSKRVVLE